MPTNLHLKKAVFKHLVMEGNSYEIGMMQGQMFKRDQERYPFLTSLPPEMEKTPKHDTKEAIAFFDKHYPGINEEIQGAADELGISVYNMSYYAFTCIQAVRRSNSGHCSQFAINPSASSDGHTYAGCSYDLHPDYNELRLCTTRVKGRASHIGFSEDIFGRADGINEYGLCVTTTSTLGGGLEYHAVVRTILDRCRTVADALLVIKSIPTSHYHNYIFTDRNGNAALVELARSQTGIKQFGPSSKDGFLISTNHYTLPATLQYDTNRMFQSVTRYRTIESHLKGASPRVTKNTIRNILSRPMPEGVCCHHYEDSLGTLWSMIFDLNEVNVETCFGAPSSNKWRLYRLDDPTGISEYVANLPYEPANPEIWRRLSPGESA
ncbi:MAG: hypothetical protein JSV15_04720 [Candidatus Bathyarchaeota archaeon]|nr:MAG: hypothetical protein JSV15_04720 [Candidatus Bathyarchaeota archaeon]